MFITKSELREQCDSYQRAVGRLAYENAELRRHLTQALRKIANTENFLAVLQGEQIAQQPTTEPN